MLTRIGKYQIQAEIGRGGFGCVYRAWDPTVSRVVAIKVLTTAREQDLLARFRNEAATAGNLRHKNIVTIYEFGEDNGAPFIAMECLEGADLHKIIAEQRPLSLMDKIDIMSQAAEGLHCAHENGVVHRDVKPANIMLQANGAVKVMDFGIARITREDATRLTHQGDLIGTLSYMSPEQFEGCNVDVSCDIWAFGVIFYELLTGRHPFRAPEAASIMRNITRGHPQPVRDLLPDCPENLARIVHRALERDRELRYGSLKDLQFDLEPILIELKRQRADKLLIQANDLFAVESLDAAQAKIREVLDLDPSSRGGRALWDVIQQKLHRRTVWPRIQILLSKGESALNQGHYNEAIREFESALHLDGTDSRVRSLLENARALAEQQQKIANMMAHGKRELEHQELARAYNIASEVLKINPDSQEAKELIASIAAERERREREQQRQDGLNKARRLFMLDDFDQAIAVLNELVSAQNVNDQVHDLLARARNKKEERRRQELLTVRIAAVKDLLHACRFDEAIQELRNLQTNFSQEPQITELLSYAEDERKTYVRTKAVEEALRDSNDHLKKRQFGAAIRLLQNTLSHYPDENKLVELLQTAMSAAEAYNREKTLAEVSRRCAELCSSERFAEAEAVINDARRQYGNESALLRLEEQVRQKREDHERVSAIRAAITSANKLLEAGKPFAAALMLQELGTRYADNEQIRSLHAYAQEQASVKRRDVIDAVRQEISRLAAANKFTEALTRINHALEEFPNDAELIALQSSIGQQKSNHESDKEKQGFVRQCLSKVGDFERLGQYSAGIETLTAALSRYPDSSDLVSTLHRLQNRLRESQRSASIARTAASIGEKISAREWSEALVLTERALIEYPGEPVFYTLRTHVEIGQEKEAEQQRMVPDVLRRAADREQADDPRDALELLQKAIKRWPESGEIAVAIASLTQRMQDAERRRGIADRLRSAEQLILERNWSAALELLHAAQREFGADPVFDQWLDRISKEQTRVENEKKQSIAALLEEAAVLERQDCISALRKIEAGLLRYPDTTELLRAAIRLRQQIRDAERRHAIEQRMDVIELHISNGDYDVAVNLIQQGRQDFPGENSFDELLERASLGLRNERFCREKLQKANALLLNGRLDKARKTVEEVLRLHPQHSEALALMDAIAGGAAQKPQSRRTPIFIAAAAVVILIAGVVALKFPRRQPASADALPVAEASKPYEAKSPGVLPAPPSGNAELSPPRKSTAEEPPTAPPRRARPDTNIRKQPNAAEKSGNQPQLPPLVQPQAPAKDNSSITIARPEPSPSRRVFKLSEYGDQLTGKLRCSGPANSAVITVRKRAASSGWRCAGDELPGPGVPIHITLRPGLRISETPSESNDWLGISFENDGATTAVEIIWQVYQP